MLKQHRFTFWCWYFFEFKYQSRPLYRIPK